MLTFINLSEAINAARSGAIPDDTYELKTLGRNAPFDLGGGCFRNVSGPPSHDEWFQGADSRYWELSEFEGTMQMFGSVDGVGDAADALDRAAKYLKGRSGTLHVKGYHTFKRKPKDFNYGFKIKGLGRSANSAFLRNYQPASSEEGFLSWVELPGAQSGGHGNGGQLRGMGVIAIAGTQGTLIRGYTPGPVTGHLDLEDLNLTYSGVAGYTRCITLTGLANKTPGGRGYRDVTMRNIYAFKAVGADESIRMSGVTNVSGNGIWASGSIIIEGSSEVPSSYINLSIECLGTLFMANTELCHTSGNVNALIHSSNTRRCRHYGSVGIGYSNHGDNSNALV